MATPTATMIRPDRNSSFCPSITLPRVEPSSAPRVPTSANTTAQAQHTLRRRAWLAKLRYALADTASALVPIATCGCAIPTT